MMISVLLNRVFPLKFITNLTCFIGISILVLASCGEDNEYPEFDDSLNIEENVDMFLQNYVNVNSPGISILVRSGGDIILNKSYGLANIESEQLINADTPFYLASVSKQFTAMSTILLEEEGKLSYNDPISTYITEAPDSWAEITIHHLLTHRSGIPDYLNDLTWYKPGLTNQEVIDDIVKIHELEFEPGARYEYSNSGYLILAIITSRVSGLPFHKFLKENIFSPLEMHSSLAYDESEPTVPSRAIGYTSNGQLSDYELLTMGDGGLFSTINDLDKWEQSFYTNQLISEDSKQIAFTSHHSSGYGYGWGVKTVEGYDHYAHGGGLNGYRTLISRIPEKKFSVIILSNGSFDWIYALRDELVRLYL